MALKTAALLNKFMMYGCYVFILNFDDSVVCFFFILSILSGGLYEKRVVAAWGKIYENNCSLRAINIKIMNNHDIKRALYNLVNESYLKIDYTYTKFTLKCYECCTCTYFGGST